MIPELFDLVRDAGNARAEQINTCFPAQVLAYDEATQRADLRPALKRPMRTDTEGQEPEELPDLFDVPVAFPRAGNFVLHIPLLVGDFVLFVCTQWNISEWYRTGDERVSPGDRAHHSLGSGIAIPGVYPESRIVSGLSASEAILGEPGHIRVAVRADVVRLGDASLPHSPVARVGDSVSVTINGPVTGLIAGATPVTLVGGTPVTITGTVTGGSATVEAAD